MTDTDATLAARKAALRLEALSRRAKMAQADRPDAALRAMGHFLNAIPLEEDDVIACYWPIRDEIDCKPLLARLMDGGHHVCLPVVTGEDRPLDMRLWEQGAALYPSGFGTLAPADDAPRAEPDLLVIPLLGFDDRGTRLGYGRGYYDRTIAAMSKTPRLVGMAFAIQQLPAIPRAAHDVPLDFVVTEDGAMAFGDS